MGWDRLIQTARPRHFDVGRLLSDAHELGYTGPIGLQCYAIPGDSARTSAAR